MDDYRVVNRANWDERAPAHAASPDYDLDAFAQDPEFLSKTVRFDLPLLGEIKGLHGVHLQCHLGTDTLSLARLGASMTGVDFSPVALSQARALAARCSADVTFVESELYEAPEALAGRQFDFVYTGIGALCWLPSIRRWAAVVGALLRPGGRLFLREGHPMLWALASERTDQVLAVEYPYFERSEATVWEDAGTYVSTDTTFTQNVTHEWNHGIAETISALLDAGFRLELIAEHDSVPWDALPGRMERLSGGEYRLTDRPWRLAHSYSLAAIKES